MAEPVRHLSSLKSGDYFKFVARKAPQGLHFFVGRHTNGIPIVAPVGNRQENPQDPTEFDARPRSKVIYS